MPLRVAIPKEITPGERRVALVPTVAERFARLGAKVVIEAGAAAGVHYPDTAYAGAEVVTDPAALYAAADVVLKVQPPTVEEIALMSEGVVLVGFLQPHRDPERVALLRDRRITSFAVELIPRISRAQSMDALSSQAAVAGYKAALLAANLSGRFFPMLTTAAGTIRPARVLVLGAGVAGLQAIATARRLGAIVEAYDVRRATKEQVQSLGAKFLEIPVDAEAAGGYARELTAEEKQQEQAMVARAVAEADAVITTAAVPGRPAPRLISAEMVAAMKPGAVIVDLAAETGGNCELTRPGEEITAHGVTIAGPLNVPSMMAEHASEMYARNLLAFLSPQIHDGRLELDWNDEVIAGAALTHAGQILHAPTRQLVEGGDKQNDD